MLIALRPNRYKKVILNNIDNGCFDEARREVYAGLINLTGIALSLKTFNDSALVEL